jgi:hypothetical protein
MPEESQSHQSAILKVCEECCPELFPELSEYLGPDGMSQGINQTKLLRDLLAALPTFLEMHGDYTLHGDTDLRILPELVLRQNNERIRQQVMAENRSVVVDG